MVRKQESVLVGSRAKRVDGVEMVCGAPIYTADMIPAGGCYVKALRAGVSHAVLKSIDVSVALASKGVLAVLTAKDIPFNSCTTIVSDKPLMASDRVRHGGDIIAAIVAETPCDAEEAASLVKFEFEPLPVISSPDEALKDDAVKIHEKGNIASRLHVRKGDVEKGFKESHVVIERVYTTPCQEPAPLEPEAAYATLEGGKIVVVGSMQNPHAVRGVIARILDIHPENIRVIQGATGGTFGGKSDEIPMELGALAALAARKLGRPAAVIYSREESILSHSHRLPFTIRHKWGATRDGVLKAVETEVYADTGAYSSVGSLVLIRGLYHIAGPYEVPNIKADAYEVYTNNCIGGSFRGFGSPQAHFAAESIMDELAEELNMDPLEIRLKNILTPGRRTLSNWEMDSSCGLEECLMRVVEESGYRWKRKAYSKDNGRIRRGIGLGVMHHGNSLGPEGADFSRAVVSIKSDIVEFRTGMTEYGTGAPTGMMQLVADILSIPLNWMKKGVPDTHTCPDAGLTVASRSTVIGGRAAQLASEKVKASLAKVASEILGCSAEELIFENARIFPANNISKGIGFWELVRECERKDVSLEAEASYQAPDCQLDVETGQGRPYLQYTFGAVAVEVEVDTELGYVKPTNVVAAYDVGKAVNPMSVEGQIEGGTIQSLGYGLMEELVLRNGVVRNPNLGDYYIPTAMDSPSIKSIIVEYPGQVGPFGAKAIGEPPIDVPHAALVNSIYHAVGVRVRDLPATPEKIITGLKKKGD